MNSELRHLAIIMDGNGRWAKRLRMPRFDGHKAGVKAVRATVSEAVRQNISVLTLFAFGMDNWKRPASEVRLLLALLEETLVSEAPLFHEKHIHLQVVGRRDRIPNSLVEKIEAIEAETAAHQGMHLYLAIDYSGQWDITNAVDRAFSDYQQQKPQPTYLPAFTSYLSFHNNPPPDLLIRTSGEQRLSNFMLWDLSYTELYFTPVLWPDIQEHDIIQAIEWFKQRERRFGCTSEQQQEHFHD